MKSSKKLQISSHLLFVYINNRDRKWRMSVFVFSSALARLGKLNENRAPISKFRPNFDFRQFFEIIAKIGRKNWGNTYGLERPERSDRRWRTRTESGRWVRIRRSFWIFGHFEKKKKIGYKIVSRSISKISFKFARGRRRIKAADFLTTYFISEEVHGIFNVKGYTIYESF